MVFLQCSRCSACSTVGGLHAVQSVVCMQDSRCCACGTVGGRHAVQSVGKGFTEHNAPRKEARSAYTRYITDPACKRSICPQIIVSHADPFYKPQPDRLMRQAAAICQSNPWLVLGASSVLIAVSRASRHARRSPCALHLPSCGSVRPYVLR